MDIHYGTSGGEVADRSEKHTAEVHVWVRDILAPVVTEKLDDLSLAAEGESGFLENITEFILSKCREENDFEAGLAQALEALENDVGGVIEQCIYNNLPYPSEAAERLAVRDRLKELIKAIIFSRMSGRVHVL